MSRPDNPHLVPVLWVCGPCGVGKTTVGWEIFSQLDRAGIKVAYVDVDQLGMCYPVPADQPHSHHVKVQNVAATVANFRAAGAECVVVSGTVDVDQAPAYAIPGASLTLCRLSVDPDEQRMRLVERGWDGDMLAEAMQEAEALDRSEFADLCVDTSGLTVAEVARLVRAGGWPLLGRAAGSEAEPLVPQPVRAAGPVLWLCGATGVGKSTVGWQIFMAVLGAGIDAAYVDLEQVGFLRPVPADDPGNHRVKASNLAATWQKFHAQGARCLIVVGSIDDRDAIRMYSGALPAGSLTLVRLHAGRDQLRDRIMVRGQGGGWRAPGDLLDGQPAATLQRIADKAALDALDLERAGIGDVRIDTDGLTIHEIADQVRAHAGSWPSWI
jgi:adenylylsulfate kinase-like enzyme